MFGQWLPIIIKSVILVEGISRAKGATKKKKAASLTYGFLNLLGIGPTQKDKDEIDLLIDGTVAVLNQEKVFKSSGKVEEEEEEVTQKEADEEWEKREREEEEKREREEEEKEEEEEEPEPKHDLIEWPLIEWPLKGYSAEVYLSRWPNGQYAELARKLLNV